MNRAEKRSNRHSNYLISEKLDSIGSKLFNFEQMNRLMIISGFIALIFTSSLFAQRGEGHGEWGKMGGQIEQLEKIKIIEELNMDEETTLRFFSRRNEHRERQRALIKKRDQLFITLSENFDADEDINYKSKMEEIIEIEKGMLIEKEEFFNSLSDILTEKEKVQLIIFEFKFRKEVRQQFMKQGRRRMNRE